MRAAVALVVALALLALGEPVAAEPDPVAAYVERALPPDASGALVAVRGQQVRCVGFGSGGCETVYDIGSVTKQFTAAAIVWLESAGRLDVRDPIGRWLGPVPPDKAAITVEQLLTHTSGLLASLGGDDERLTRRQLVAQALAAPLRTAPGSAYHYSNVGYSLLAVVVERASGTSYERFLRRHLFRPAGMRSTGYVLPDWSRREVAVERDEHGVAQGTPLDHPWAGSGPWWNLRGNGGLLSTALDMARWHRALSAGRVLDRQALRRLFRPRVPEEPGGDSHYGYGWVLLDTPVGAVAWHNGGNGRSYAELLRVLGRGTMVFWVTSEVRSAGRWDLSRRPITSDVVRLLLGPRP